MYKPEYDQISGNKSYLVVDSQKRVCGTYKTLLEACTRIANLPRHRTYHVIVEVSMIDFDHQMYFDLQGNRIA